MLESMEPAYYENNEVMQQNVYLKLISYIKSIRYGSVTIVIHDGKITQIDKNEKHRFK